MGLFLTILLVLGGLPRWNYSRIGVMGQAED